MTPAITNPPKAMSKLKAIMSIGQAAAMIQFLPDRIHTAASALSIEPAMRINNVAYFTEHDVERIGKHLRSEVNQHAAS